MRVVGAAVAAVEGPRAAAAVVAGVTAKTRAATAEEVATTAAHPSEASPAGHALEDECDIVATRALADR